MACSMGVVARVVTTAMSTNIAKSVGERTPRSSPTFRTTSSIRPRVFMRMPSEAASLLSDPVMCAAKKLPQNLPTEAIRI